MSCSNQIICYTSPHLSLHVPFFFLLIILTHCYVIVYSFYYPPLQAYLQYKKSLSNIIHLSHRQIQIFTLIISHISYQLKHKKKLPVGSFFYSLIFLPAWGCLESLRMPAGCRLSVPYGISNLVFQLCSHPEACVEYHLACWCPKGFHLYIQ